MAPRQALLIHYLVLRRLVGLVGVALPIVLPFGLLVIGERPYVRDSISAYHATSMRDYYVALISTVGVFLAAYKGYEGHRVLGLEVDVTVARAAALFAALLVFCPFDGDRVMNALHLVGGTGMFSCLAIFSFFLFTRGNPHPTKQKRRRNLVYRTCGVVIVVCMVLMGIEWFFLEDTWVHSLRPTFWIEGVMLFAFALSWAVKGEVLLTDD